jgi:hypothetical protein
LGNRALEWVVKRITRERQFDAIYSTSDFAQSPNACAGARFA